MHKKSEAEKGFEDLIRGFRSQGNEHEAQIVRAIHNMTKDWDKNGKPDPGLMRQKT